MQRNWFNRSSYILVSCANYDCHSFLARMLNFFHPPRLQEEVLPAPPYNVTSRMLQPKDSEVIFTYANAQRESWKGSILPHPALATPIMTECPRWARGCKTLKFIAGLVHVIASSCPHKNYERLPICRKQQFWRSTAFERIRLIQQLLLKDRESISTRLGGIFGSTWVPSNL